MKKLRFLTALGCFALAGPAMAGNYEWTAGWGMGVTEYHVSDGNGNELMISCPDGEETGQMDAYALVNGRGYSSHGSGPEQFDVIVDGEHYSNPFYTDCRVCDANFPYFWEALRHANNLSIRVENATVRLPTTNLDELLHPFDSELNSCRSAW